MALRALGRSRVMTATPLGKTRPLTNSSAAAAAAAMAANRRTRRRGTRLGLGARGFAGEEKKEVAVEIGMREKRARIATWLRARR
jgi:hypothetical protein